MHTTADRIRLEESEEKKKKKRKIFYLAFTTFGMEQHQITCNAAAVAVTQLLLAGEETGQARGAWRAPADCQDAFHTRGLSAGTPEEETCKHSRKASFC